MEGLHLHAGKVSNDSTSIDWADLCREDLLNSEARESVGYEPFDNMKDAVECGLAYVRQLEAKEELTNRGCARRLDGR